MIMAIKSGSRVLQASGPRCLRTSHGSSSFPCPMDCFAVTTEARCNDQTAVTQRARSRLTVQGKLRVNLLRHVTGL